MAGDETSASWERLPAGIREQVDGYVLQDAFMQAVRTVLDVGRARGLSLGDAQQIVSDRYAHHGDRIARTPDSPLDLESLTARAESCHGRVVAVEAVWDGDTVHDWFVRLLAVTADPDGERRLATVYHGTAVRYLGDGGERGEAGRTYPSAVAADRCGRALAAQLAVPFHFGSPDTRTTKPPAGGPERRRGACATGRRGAYVSPVSRGVSRRPPRPPG
ncbi:hypothetical protein [Actinacidiphila yeochonensis]|uniref:hypothetical protein n=1 Tax=Actinacidiphila yeochonensis TaxID=89050 RepID=UPI000AC2D9F5|nr:hypothetical protein [Actinacidiphila yeochonensis]